MSLDLAGQQQITSVSAPINSGVKTMSLDKQITTPELAVSQPSMPSLSPISKPSTINVTVSDNVVTDWFKDPNRVADKQGRPTSYINTEGQKVNIYQAGVALPVVQAPLPLVTLPPKTIDISGADISAWQKDPSHQADVFGRPTSYIDQTTGQKIIIAQGAYTASVGPTLGSSGGTYTSPTGQSISREQAMGTGSTGSIDAPLSIGIELAKINAPKVSTPVPILEPVKMDTTIPTQGSISDLNPFGSIIGANPMKPISTPAPVVAIPISPSSITSQFGEPTLGSSMPISAPSLVSFPTVTPQKGSIAEQKAQSDTYAAREKESITTPFLHLTQDVSKNLQSEADKILGVTNKTIPGLGTFASGAASTLTSIPAMVGMAAFSGEQIIRHPTELAKVATIGAPLLVSQTVQSAEQDPFRFGGSVVGMVALGESGKVLDVAKNIKFEEASGIRSLRETMPDINLKESSLKSQQFSEVMKDITQPTSRMESLGAAKELFGGIKEKISTELSQPTTRQAALSDAQKLVGNYGQSISTELAKPTLRQASLTSAKEVVGETKTSISKELAKPTQREEAITSLNLNEPTSRMDALVSTKNIVSDFGKSLQGSKGYRPEITSLDPSTSGVRYLFGGEKYIPATSIIEPKVISGEKRFPVALKGTSAEQLVKEFKTSQYRIPGTEEKIGGWHATPQEFAKTTKAQIGSSKSPGMYIAPSTSPHFLKLTPGDAKIFGFGDKPSHPAAIFLEVKDIERAPKGKRTDVKAYNEFMTNKAEKGKAFISSEFEQGIKPEKEAIVPPETPITRVSNKYATEWEGKKVPVMEYTVDKTPSMIDITSTEGKETFGGLSERQSKAYSEYRGYKKPIITPSTLLWGSVASSQISNKKPYTPSSIVESSIPSSIKSSVSDVRSPISSISKSNIPSGISSLISGGKSSNIISSKTSSYSAPTISSPPKYYSSPESKVEPPYYSPPKYSPPGNSYPGYNPIYSPNEPLRPYQDRFWNETLKSEIPYDAFDKNGEKVESKKKRKIGYTYKRRDSPIFGGAEKLFEGMSNPIKQASNKAQVKRSQVKGNKIPTFDLGLSGSNENPIERVKSKAKHTKNVNKNKKPSWL